MTETELDRWAAIYEANPALARANIDYAELLDDPGVLFRVGEHPAPDPDAYLALLPAQRRIATRIRRDEAIADAVRARGEAARTQAEGALPIGARHCGEAFIETLSHHAYKSNSERCRQTRPLR